MPHHQLATDPECRALVLLSPIICNTIGSAILHRVHPTAMDIPGHPVRAAAMGKDQCLPTSWLPAAEIHCPSPLRGRRRTAERSCLLPAVERDRVLSTSSYLPSSSIVLIAYPPLSYHLQKSSIVSAFRHPRCDPLDQQHTAPGMRRDPAQWADPS
jgi:hypothetical protein